MGRANLEIKYWENLRARRSTYMARMKGVKKKASKLSLLYGVDVLVASLSPELNTVEFWPEKDTPEFHWIRERYLHFRKKKNNCSGDEGNENNEQQTPCLSVPFPSFFLSIFHEEMVAMEMKLKDVTERIYFFQACSQNENHVDQCQKEEEQLQGQSSIFRPFHHDLLHPVEQPFYIPNFFFIILLISICLCSKIFFILLNNLLHLSKIFFIFYNSLL